MWLATLRKFDIVARTIFSFYVTGREFMARPSDSIALVRAKDFGDLPDRLTRLAGERILFNIFEKEGVPLAVSALPRMPVPLRAMMGLFSRSAAALDNRTLGVEVGEQMTHRGYGLWIEYASAAATLGEALARAVDASWAQQLGSRMELVVEGGHSIIRFATPALGVSKTQYDDHLLPSMLSFVRLYLGDGWRPDWAEVDYRRDPGAGLVEDRLRIPLRFARPGTGLALRTGDLSRRRIFELGEGVRIVTLRDVLADVVLANAPEPARALSAAVALRLLNGQSDIDGAARLIGLGVQGLQRRLRQKGYTYREIVDAARRARAIRLLLETRLSVLAIGLSLGYETHASFTRAFVRWTGSTPSAFRRGDAPRPPASS